MNERRNHGRWGLWWIKAIVTAGLIVLILRRVSLAEVVERTKAARPDLLAIAAALAVLFTLLKSAKWHYLVVRAGGGGRFAGALRSYLIGMGTGLVTPGRVGEVGRAMDLPAGERLRGVGLVGVDKLLDLGAVFSMASVGGFAVIGGGAGVAFATVAVLLFGILYRAQMLTTIVRRLPSGDRATPVLEAFEAPGRHALNLALAMTFAAYALVLVEFYLLVVAFEPAPFRPVLLVFPVVMLMNVLPVTIGGLGIREGTAALLLSQFGVSEESAVGAAFLIFVFNTLLPGLIGALLLLRRRTNGSSPSPSS